MPLQIPVSYMKHNFCKRILDNNMKDNLQDYNTTKENLVILQKNKNWFVSF